jgi:ribonuclease P protein component
VSKAVGNSVVRHRVARRLRHLMAPRLADLPAGADVVVRALPAAAQASSEALSADLEGALRSALLKAEAREQAAAAAGSPS